jgi:hypothetical protein
MPSSDYLHYFAVAETGVWSVIALSKLITSCSKALAAAGRSTRQAGSVQAIAATLCRYVALVGRAPDNDGSVVSVLHHIFPQYLLFWRLVFEWPHHAVRR